MFREYAFKIKKNLTLRREERRKNKYNINNNKGLSYSTNKNKEYALSVNTKQRKSDKNI